MKDNPYDPTNVPPAGAIVAQCPRCSQQFVYELRYQQQACPVCKTAVDRPQLARYEAAQRLPLDRQS